MIHYNITDVHAVSTEVAIARLIAQAANRPRDASDDVSRIEFLFSDKGDWDRSARDTFLLCADRAVSRIHPPLDALQYTQTATEFRVTDNGTRVALLFVQPTARHFGVTPTATSHVSCAPHTVEGESDESTERVGGTDAPLEDGQAQQQQQRWRLAAWLTARFFNEVNWCSANTLRVATKIQTTSIAETTGVVEAAVKRVEGGACVNAVLAKTTNSVLEAATRSNGRRLLHVDVAGMEVSAVIVAQTQRYAYAAVPTQKLECSKPEKANGNRFCPTTTNRWFLIARVPVPSAIGDDFKFHSSRKRPRQQQQQKKKMKMESKKDHTVANMASDNNYCKCAEDEKMYDAASLEACGFSNAVEIVSHDAGPLRLLSSASTCNPLSVTLRAHKVYCRSFTSDNISVIFEDVAIVAPHNPAVRGNGSMSSGSCSINSFTEPNTFADVMEIVTASCTRFLRGYVRYGEQLTETSAASRLFAGLTDTISVHFRKARGRSEREVPLAITSVRDVAALYEGTCVEFKARVEAWRGEAQQHGTTNAERFRHTMAAMAATRGGTLFIGVADDGHIIGHTRGALDGMRLNGFCPAMVKGAIATVELRADAPTQLPKEWWKKTITPSAAGNPPPSGGEKVGGGKRGEREEKDKVVTVLTVSRGQAPFYTTSRHSVPYMRGLASTVPMPITVCAWRMTQQLQ